jgi:hypothetical protein
MAAVFGRVGTGGAARSVSGIDDKPGGRQGRSRRLVAGSEPHTRVTSSHVPERPSNISSSTVWARTRSRPVACNYARLAADNAVILITVYYLHFWVLDAAGGRHRDLRMNVGS